MRRPAFPAILCLVVMSGCHRHLVLYDDPVGASRAKAVLTRTGWHIRVMVQGVGWTARSVDEALDLHVRDDGACTRIEWDVSSGRWGQASDYKLALAREGKDVLLVIENSSMEWRGPKALVKGVVTGTAVTATVVGSFMVDSQDKVAHQGLNGENCSLETVSWWRALFKGPPPAFNPGLQRAATPPGEGPQEPVVALESMEGWMLPGHLRTAIRGLDGEWEARVDLNDLPDGEIWRVQGEGFEVTSLRQKETMQVHWRVSKEDRERARPYLLQIQTPQGECRVKLVVR